MAFRIDREDLTRAVPETPEPFADILRLALATAPAERRITMTQIAERLESPVGQPTIRELCRGKTRPVVIVDDLNRPTPAHQVLPALLRQFDGAQVSTAAGGSLVFRPTHLFATTRAAETEPIELMRGDPRTHHDEFERRRQQVRQVCSKQHPHHRRICVVVPPEINAVKFLKPNPTRC